MTGLCSHEARVPSVCRALLMAAADRLEEERVWVGGGIRIYVRPRVGFACLECRGEVRAGRRDVGALRNRALRVAARRGSVSRAVGDSKVRFSSETCTAQPPASGPPRGPCRPHLLPRPTHLCCRDCTLGSGPLDLSAASVGTTRPSENRPGCPRLAGT